MSVGFHYDSLQSANFSTVGATVIKATFAVGKPCELVRWGFTAFTAIVVPVGGFQLRLDKADADGTTNLVTGAGGTLTQPASTNIAVNNGIYREISPLKFAQHQVIQIFCVVAATSGTGFGWIHYRPLDAHSADRRTFAEGNLMGQYLLRAS